ncbi:MAG TPA: hypothetical protein PLS94_13790, partial [Prolixibacteraceae bacterium]|nr:hypothetical protein [Prolixibacteraceae bacterium]
MPRYIQYRTTLSDFKMTENERKVTPISDLGEFGLIDHLTNKIKLKNSSTLLGVGDDAAILDFKDEEVVI